MSTLKEKILGGVLWSVFNKIGLQILTVTITAALARILTPQDFGLVAMVTLATGFLSVIKDFGFGAALVQKKEVTQEEYSSVFWFNIIIGSCLTLLVWFSAPYIADFYDNPALKSITRVLSFNFLLTSGSIVLSNMLVKQMRFKQIFYRSILSNLISGIGTISLALLGYGYWALVFQSYFSTITMLLFTYLIVKWKPSLSFNWQLVKDLMPFSLPLIGDQSLNYWTRNIDNLLIGKFFGTAELAFYSRAYSLMLLPVRQISGTITKVLFPSFSLIQNDIGQVRRIYFKISGVIALISFPMMTYLFVMANEVILLLLGKQWTQAVPIFQILCFLGMMQSIGTLIGNVFMSQGKTYLMMRIGILSKGMMISGIIIGIMLGGVKEVALGYVISSLIAFVPETYFLGKLLKTNLFLIFRNFINQLFCAILMSGGLYYIMSFIENINYIFRILISFPIAAILYITLIIITKDSSFKNLSELYNDQRKRKKSKVSAH